MIDKPDRLWYHAYGRMSLCIMGGDGLKGAFAMQFNHVRRVAAAVLALALLLSACSLGASTPRGAGSLVAWIGEDGLMLYRMDDGTSELLVAGSHLSAPVFSADGRYLYYRNSCDVFCQPLAGGRPLLAAVNAEYVGEADGCAVFRSQTAGVTRYDPVQGTSSVLIEQPTDGVIGDVTFSPDRKRTVYTVCATDVGRTELVSVCVTVPGAAEPDVYPASQYPAGALLYALAWSPDGSVCYMAVGAAGSETQRLYLFSPMDGSMVPLSAGRTSMLLAAADTGCSANGAVLLTEGYASENDLYESPLQVDLTAAKAAYLPGGYAPTLGLAISGDGAAVAWALDAGDVTEAGLFVRTMEKTLSICTGTFCCPVFSGDGQTLWFLETTEDAVDFCRSPANSAGKETLFTGVLRPDGVERKTLRDCFCIYDTTQTAQNTR